MGHRLSQIVTRTGDDGSTGLADGSRRAKHDIRIHCLGEIDELNAGLGLLISLNPLSDINDILRQFQHDLFDLGAEISQPGKQLLNEEYAEAVEQAIETLNAQLPALEEFILPGGSPLISQVHLVRCWCRRTERTFFELHQQEELNPASLRYLNRLSDLLFILARYLARQEGQQEVYWQSRYSRIPPAS